MSEKIIQDTKVKIEKAIEAFQREMGRVRTGRASLSLLEDIRVDYYGQLVPLNQVATLSVPEARLITIAPWESNIISAIEKAIDKANIGVNPVNDGKIVRIPIPALTEERRKEFVKQIKKMGEEAKVAIRNVRRDSIDGIKKKEVSEDETHRFQDEIQKLTDHFSHEVDRLVDTKSKEVMTL